MIFQIYLACGEEDLLRETAEEIRRRELPAIVGCYRSAGGLLDAKHLSRADLVLIDAELAHAAEAVRMVTGLLPAGRVLVCGEAGDERLAEAARRCGAAFAERGEALGRTIEALLTEAAPAREEGEADCISSALNARGLTEELKGSRYIAEAVRRILADPSNAENLSRDLYPVIAAHCHDSARNVERSMRYAIEASWERMNGAQRRRLMPQCSHRPGNKMFLRQMARQVGRALEQKEL